MPKNKKSDRKPFLVGVTIAIGAWWIIALAGISISALVGYPLSLAEVNIILVAIMQLVLLVMGWRSVSKKK